ncbi:C1-like DC1 containing protein [Parasponia andersonii]|uniref:C1-like DC1 containing protein n=1 Tax=Parasponia andersonii TaxID=3476 RepID=A0A2P5DUE4_PARAD|nr:C1-like DC1 containing protein [Parasponia andersonii]
MTRYNEISHFSHPHHKLKFDCSEFPFKCDGCKEVGIGSRYKCSICDFDLHMYCAIHSPSIVHPFYTKCSFQFLLRPPGNSPRYCNACEKDVTGFVYHCHLCGFDLHPCCAKLPMVLDDGETKLNLYQKVSSSCHRCGRKGRSWSYRSTCKKYNLHVACVREMLMESWWDIYAGRGKGKGMSSSTSMSNGNSNNYNYKQLETRIPSLKNTLQTHHRRSGKGKVKKCCEIAGLAVQFVISAVLGDPTALIAGFIGILISRA